jgi:two-component sensor histidine kinase
VVQRFLWHARDLKDEQLNSFFISALVDMRASLILQNGKGDYLCVTSLPDCWSVGSSSTPNDAAIFGERTATQLSECKLRAHRTGVTELIEISPGEDRIFEFRVLSVRDRAGEPQVITTIIDRSEERRRERVLQQLLREVSHRSKNLLAIIQSIATQTSHYAESIDSYVQKFRGRIFSLSRSQDLITDSGWRGAYIRELLEQQTASYLASRPSLIHFSGKDTLLSPNAAMHLGLAFHELIINALTHGSVLRTGDLIEVTSNITRSDEGDRTIHITWDEPLAPLMAPSGDVMLTSPARFGRAILERVVPVSVGGTARYAIGSTRVYYEMSFPVDNADKA